MSLDRFPRTRFQGSKRKLLRELGAVFERRHPGVALDLYSGSGTVSLLLRQMGHTVVSNDYLAFANNTAWVFLNATQRNLAGIDWRVRLEHLLHHAPLNGRSLVQDKFGGIYFTDEENRQIDRFAQNVNELNQLERAVSIYAIGQALLMKRPYNLFHRANLSMRRQNVKRTFGNAVTWERPIIEHACGAINEIATFPFNDDSRNHRVINVNTTNLSALAQEHADLVYIDPPYVASNGKAIDYADFYHFLEGLLDYSRFELGNLSMAHRPIVSHDSRWSSPDRARIELAEIALIWPTASLIMSYRDDGAPSARELIDILRAGNRSVDRVNLHPYKYALSSAQATSELLLVARPLLPCN